jgi:hypothetical protein
VDRIERSSVNEPVVDRSEPVRKAQHETADVKLGCNVQATMQYFLLRVLGFGLQSRANAEHIGRPARCVKAAGSYSKKRSGVSNPPVPLVKDTYFWIWINKFKKKKNSG